MRSPPLHSDSMPLAVDGVAQLEKLLGIVHRSEDPAEDLLKHAGFSIQKCVSSVQGAGNGVLLRGRCQAGQIVCLYPGTVYMPFEPLLFASIANSYILRCYDGLFVDGKSTGLSARIFRSIYHRENWPGAIQTSDITWITDELRNPLAIGQIVNNGTSTFHPNVQYHEIDLPPSFPTELRQYLPNIYWNGLNTMTHYTRVVALMATKDIKDTELFSTYMDTV
ncbi:hypothetical protein BDB00DRAFT_264733 [Zychaea mexicana]|uniref:uncharacterized protein n=1 Tax=Zychaea mexicana TaxID=64656 RepID=UPI0022FE887C|nr:uncharacterized protein BDB00DRAFT_264733 [Zychaea mexicana]KAI9469320.1 hypothetical protein BDB00DRAFT_264733 [Zychaea mexicana]